jgi:hypothetical protein
MNVDLDFLAKEWPVITGAPHLVFGGIIAIIVLVEAANNAFRSVIGIATGASVSPQTAIPDFAPSLETHAVVADRIDPT